MLAASLTSLLLPALALAAPAKRTWEHADHHDSAGLISSGVFEFTSTYVAHASADTIINNNQTAVPGLPDGYGTFKFGIIAPEDVICYSIAVYISGNYSSPAATATHIHEAVAGKAGPPRLAFPNPTSDAPIDEFGRRTSYGCLKGPFTTGLLANGADTATNFTLAQIEANPPGFFADTHTVEFPAGAIRGQIELVESSY